jgi:hypothetical protein
LVSRRKGEKIKTRGSTKTQEVSVCYRKGKMIHLSVPPEGLLRLSRAFSATLTGRFGLGTVRMGAEVRW